jgi:hypothetical protein
MNNKIWWWNQEVTNTKGYYFVMAIIIILFTHYVVGIWEKDSWELECEARIEERREWWSEDYHEMRDKLEANISWCEENLYRCAGVNCEDIDLHYFADRYEGWVP